MNLKDVSYLLAYIGTKTIYRAGLGKVDITDAAVRSWKSDLDHGNCYHLHIAIRAVEEHFRSPQGNYGITPAELVNAYNHIANRILERSSKDVLDVPPDDVAAYLAAHRKRIHDTLANPDNLAMLDSRPERIAIEPVKPPADVVAAISLATPKLTPRPPTTDPERMAKVRAELDARRAKLTEGEPA